MRPEVLVIDDEKDYREILAQVIEDLGYAVETASDGEAGLALLQGGRRPDLILLDLAMPGMDGATFLDILRADPDPAMARVPVVVMTGMTPVQARQVIGTRSASALLLKPFGATELQRTLRLYCRATETATAGDTPRAP